MNSLHSRRRAGFTLIEVMLTLLIMGGIMVSITQILRAARIARDSIHNVQETQLAGPAIMDMLERDLRALLIYNRDRTQHLRVTDRVMRGLDGDSLDFVCTTDSVIARTERDRTVRGDVNEVGYRLRPSPAYDDFLEIYRREDMGVDDEPYDGGEFSFLHDRVKGFEIRVFLEDGIDAEALDEWGQERGDPEHVGIPARLEITLILELSPRIAREQIRIQSTERRTQVYKRVIRLPEILRVEETELVLLSVPTPPGAGGQNAGGFGTGFGEEGQGDTDGSGTTTSVTANGDGSMTATGSFERGSGATLPDPGGG